MGHVLPFIFGVPWWGWMLVALWCFPAVYAAISLFRARPMLALDENGEPYRQAPLLTRLIFLPVAFAILVVVWPWAYWSDYRRSRSQDC